MPFLSKYGVARHIYVPMVKRGVVDHAVSADWTPAGGDVKISKDGGAAANVTNLPAAIAMGNSTIWDFSLTATEMQAAQVMVTIADSATKAVEDSAFIIETHGNASGQFQVDLADSVRAGLTALPNAAVSGVGGLLTAPTTANVGLADLSRILGTALTETSGQIAAAFKQFFNIASPTSTMNLITTVTTATNLTNLPAITSNWLTAAGIAASALNGKGDWNIGKTGYALSAAGVQAIWDALTSALTTVGSIGKLLVDNVNASISAIKTKTDFLPSATAGAAGGVFIAGTNAATSITTGLTSNLIGNITGNLSGSVGSVTGAVGSVTGLTASNLDATISSRLASASYTAPDNTGIGQINGRLPSDPADASDIAGAFGVVGSAISGLSIPTANQNADALLDRADAIETGLTVRGALRLDTAVLAGKVSGAGTGTEVFRNAVADSKNRISATVTAAGNRTAITTDAT